MIQPKHTILTHAGAFHADEIMAIVLLQKFYLIQPVRVAKNLSHEEGLALIHGRIPPHLATHTGADGIEDARTPCLIVRTRAPDLLAQGRHNPAVFVVDVGGERNDSKLNFDHHQEAMRETWPDGTPLSSTGLLWLWLQKQGHLSELSPALQSELEQSLIKPLDAHDNGVAMAREGEVVEGYNRSSVDPEVQIEQFEKALGFMKETFDNFLYLAQAKLEAETTMRTAWEQAKALGDRHVVLDEPLSYSDGAGLLKRVSEDEAEVLAIRGKGKRFSVISLPIDTAFSIKCPMPEAWRGQMDFQLEAEGRTITMPFAHKTGFMCVAEGTAEDAHAVCRHVVEHNLALRSGPARKKSPSP